MPDGERMICKLCRNEVGNVLHAASEKMYGLGHQFMYLACGDCGCLQLVTPNIDHSLFYPTNYYSYRLTNTRGWKKLLERKLKTWRSGIVLHPTSTFRKWLLKRFPNAGISALAMVHAQIHDRILDVGCGNGALIFDLAQNGFKNVLGIDPFVEKSFHYPNGARVLKQSLQDTDGIYDVIMMHHAFEHMEDPLAVLQALKWRLAPSGLILIRIPIAGSEAWEIYGTDWVQLDAPRHLYLHTLKSINLLAEKVGLRVKNVVYDGTAFQYWGSEMYRMKLPLLSNPSEPAVPSKQLFSAKQLRDFNLRARMANSNGKSDQAAFFLGHAEHA